ncbi:hypothetical protein [Azotobacter armeniacus]
MGALLDLVLSLTPVPTSAAPLVEVASAPSYLLAQCGDGQEGGEMPPSADDEPQHVIRTAATASPAWRETRDQYHAHIFACRACYAPLGRHCAVGAELRAIYDSTPWS